MRLIPRLLGAIVYALLPLASEEELGSTSLLSIGAAVSGFVVIWEMISGLECGAAPFESWRGRVDDLNALVHVGSKSYARQEIEAQNKVEDDGDICHLQRE